MEFLVGFPKDSVRKCLRNPEEIQALGGIDRFLIVLLGCMNSTFLHHVLTSLQGCPMCSVHSD